MRQHSNSERCAVVALCLLVVLGSGWSALASIRVDGSEYQSTSSRVYQSVSQSQKGLGQSARPVQVVLTMGQAVMAQGALPDAGGEFTAFRIGMGYEYNVLKTAYDNGCACPCFADPECDGITNVLDVVRAINAAFRGAEMGSHENCPRWLTDVDCSGSTDVLDVTALVDITFHDADPASLVCLPCAE